MAFTGDDFAGASLGGFWTTTDPNSNCTFTQSGGTFSIGLSSGQAHDYYVGNHTAPRLTQAVTDDQFRITVKFNNAVNAAFKMNGLIFFQDTNNVVRCDTYFNDLGQQKIFASTSSADAFTNQVDSTITATNPIWIRVTRAGSTWTQEYSSDGVSFTQAVQFTKSLSMTSAGIVAANADPGTGAPAFTSQAEFFQVDYPSKPVVLSSAVSRAAWF
jgi:regulation of enolase protein 1 (concanavalin A-like superfamily)